MGVAITSKETLERLAIECKNLAEIAKRLGISREAAKARLQRIGLPTPRGAQFRERKRLFLQLYEAKTPLVEIARQLGISMVSARQRLRDHGLSAMDLPGCRKIYTSDVDYPIRTQYRRFQGGSGKRRFQTDLSFEAFKYISEKPCFYCGMNPAPRNLPADKGHNNKDRIVVIASGLDRIDSSKGYILGNIVPCCPHCNYAKNDYSLEEFCHWFNQRRLPAFFLTPQVVIDGARQLAMQFSNV